MKKLLSLLLIILIPVAAYAQDRDPVIGSWYYFMDFDDAPEMASASDGYNRVIGIMSFLNSGSVMCVLCTETNREGDASCELNGKWHSTDHGYSCELTESGQEKTYSLFFDGDSLYFGSNNIYMKLHRLLPVNPYEDVRTK